MNTTPNGSKPSTMVITPEEAQFILDTCKYEHQRRLYKEHVAYLAEEMRLSNFHQMTTIILGDVSGRNVLLDGQHRLAAVVQSGLAQQFVVVTERMTEQEAAWLYTRIDQQKKRQFVEMYRVLALSEKWDMVPTNVNYLSRGVSFIVCEFVENRQRVHPTVLLAAMEDYIEPMRMYLDITTGLMREMRTSALRTATLSVALVTLRYSRNEYGDQVDKFWRGTLTFDGLQEGDPRRLAYMHLMTTGMAGGAGGPRRKAKTAPKTESARYLSAAFNGWVREKRMSLIRIANPNAPIQIMGSPFDGKERK